MSSCGEDLHGLLTKTRYGKTLRTNMGLQEDDRATKLLQVLGRVLAHSPRNAKRRWLAVVQSCGYRRTELVTGFAWRISKATWSKALSQRESIPLPYASNRPSSTVATPTPTPTPHSPLPNSTVVEAMEVEAPVALLPPSTQQRATSTSRSQRKEDRHPSLLPFMGDFFQKLSFPCPHTNKATMPYSLNRLFRIYTQERDKPCSLSLSCFRRIWREHFKQQYRKAKHRDGLCQLCEIGHKLEKIEEQHPTLTEMQKKQLLHRKNIVLRHKLANQEIKDQYYHQLRVLKVGEAMLTIDFKENITLGSGPRELGQSWYQRERRTIFGMALLKRESDGSISKWHWNIVTDCLTHDAIFVKTALSSLFASDLWTSFNIQKLAIWCDNAPHFRNKILLAYLLDLVKQNDFQEVYLCFFEPYHGKSEVDSMFGILTSWISNWKANRYLNTTADVLECFKENNQFLPSPNQNIFLSLSFDSSLWTQKGHNYVKNIKSKAFNYFAFNSKVADSITTLRLRFRTNKENGALEYTSLEKLTKVAQLVRGKPTRSPKYSKRVELVNSATLTEGDEDYLKKKASAWGLYYKR